MQQDEAVSVRGGSAPILVQIDKGVGKQFLLIIWLSAFVSAVAVVALMVLWSAYRDTRAHVNTMQYDLAQVKAQLIEKGLYEPTSH
jgi:hypothetical protein